MFTNDNSTFEPENNDVFGASNPNWSEPAEILCDDLGFRHASTVKVNLTDDYLIKGVLSAGTLSVIYGPSNSGKTFFALDMAYRIASGIRWYGKRVRQALVLYIATEGGRGMDNRVAAVRERHEAGDAAAHFYYKNATVDLLDADSADIGKIIRTAKFFQQTTGVKQTLIVIDTLARVMAGGDENGPADMTKVVANIDAIREATGAHVMLVHHTGKDATRGARGHSSLRGAVDTEIEVTAQGDDGTRQAVTRKQRDYAGNEEFPFALEEVPLGVDGDGDDVKTCIAVAVKTANPFDGVSPQLEDETIATIGAYRSDGERYTDANTNTGDRWAGNVIMTMMGKDKDEAADILTRWIRNGRLERVEYPSPKRRRMVTGLVAANGSAAVPPM